MYYIQTIMKNNILKFTIYLYYLSLITLLIIYLFPGSIIGYFLYGNSGIQPNLVDGKDSLGNSVKKRMIGIKLSSFNNEFQKERLGLSKSIYYAVNEVWFVCITSLKYLVSMISGSADSSQLGGPIRIAKITGQVAEHGIIPFLSITAYISISLGLINLFPIPMLDGGHLLFYAFEKILGRPLKQKTQEGFFRIGLFLLFFLMFFVTFNDLKDIGLF